MPPPTAPPITALLTGSRSGARANVVDVESVVLITALNDDVDKDGCVVVVAAVVVAGAGVVAVVVNSGASVVDDGGFVDIGAGVGEGDDGARVGDV